PPVFVAGSFTGWSPLEMTCEKTEATESRHLFSYTVDLKPGKYQYKFRLGPGDWWVLDESAPTGGWIISLRIIQADDLAASDNSGNVNNVLTVEPDEQKAPNDTSENKSDVLTSAANVGKASQTDEAVDKIARIIPPALDKRPQSPNLAN